MNDPVWMAMQREFHIFHRVGQIPLQVYHAWSPFPELARDASPAPLLSPMALHQLRQSVTERPLSSVAKIAEMGKSYHEQEQAYKVILRLREQSKKRSAQDRHILDVTKAARLPGDQAKGASAKEKMEEMQREMEAALAKYSAQFNGRETERISPLNSNDPSQRLVASSLLRLSPVAKVRIHNSTSTKLDYILNEVS